MNAPTITEYRAMFSDILRFLNWALPQEKTDEFWTRAALSSIDLTEVYRNTPLSTLCDCVTKAILEEVARTADGH